VQYNDMQVPLCVCLVPLNLCGVCSVKETCMQVRLRGCVLDSELMSDDLRVKGKMCRCA
jgi:hypothetical protein